MYVTVTGYSEIEAKTEDFDSIAFSPTGPESKSLEEGMYVWNEDFKVEFLYDQLLDLKDKIKDVLGEDPTIESIDIDVVVGPAEARSLRTKIRNKAVDILDPHINDDQFVFAFTHFMQALDLAADNGVLTVT